MIKVGDSVYVDKHAAQEYVVVAVDGDMVTAVQADAHVRTADVGNWYDINGNLRWA